MADLLGSCCLWRHDTRGASTVIASPAGLSDSLLLTAQPKLWVALLVAVAPVLDGMRTKGLLRCRFQVDY